MTTSMYLQLVVLVCLILTFGDALRCMVDDPANPGVAKEVAWWFVKKHQNTWQYVSILVFFAVVLNIS